MSSSNLLSSLRPLIWASKLFGLLPFTFTKTNNTIKVKTSIFECAYGLCLVISVTLFRSILFHMAEGDSVTYYVFKIGCAIVGVFSVSTIVSYFWYLKTARNLHEEALGCIKYISVKNFERKVFWAISFEILLFWILLELYYILYYFSYPDEFHKYLIIDLVTESYLRYVITFINIQFSSVVMCFYFVFMSINQELKSNLRFVRLGSVLPVKNKMNLIMENGDISNLVETYEKICRLCKKSNKCFGGSMLISAISTFVQILLSLYYVLVVKEDTPAMFVTWFIYYAIEEWFVLFACESVVSEVSTPICLTSSVQT